MQLNRVITGITAQQYNMKDVEVSTIEFDSRKVTPGALYVALEGDKYDGHKFIKDVEQAGAVAVITQKKINCGLPQIVVEDSRAILGALAKNFYGHFSELIKVGITGTNGKTTTAFLLHSILSRAGKNPGLIGTVYYQGGTRRKAGHTTPEILDILRLFKEYQDEGITSIVMEVSSHALKLKRVEEIDFDAAVFTNLSQDHLDFHGTMEEYRHAKLHLFSLLKPGGWAVYNNDQAVSAEILKLPLEHRLSFGTTQESDVWAQLVDDSLEGLRLIIHHADAHYEVVSPLVGTYNLYNILAAFTSAIALGVDAESIRRGIKELSAVRGRMERVVDSVFVDFAHTPSALENILQSARKYTRGRLFVVFGCGGDRDRTKRPRMGAISTRLADLTVITSDNPRSESPTHIIEEIKQGVVRENYKAITDRKAAIEYAMRAKDKEDLVIVAGKGHEEYQLVGDQTIEFDDAEVIRECFANLR
ncbi:MAG: UDP-N-acetylmuramoyl-L-alanyl-D-glutamate--2,6-diaminopimelate ligase [candidate division WOR-3 bacterium]|jgi:UDP-N-acetylmuramoyl-L-alanyl-D-glutamate--2,6-diaminopimelate ligase